MDCYFQMPLLLPPSLVQFIVLTRVLEIGKSNLEIVNYIACGAGPWYVAAHVFLIDAICEGWCDGSLKNFKSNYICNG